MTNTSRLGDKAPREVWIAAYKQWAKIFVLRTLMIILGLLMSWIIVFCSRKRPFNRFGEPSCRIDKRYYPHASDWWHFYSIPSVWRSGNKLQRFIWYFGNDEDGCYGDRRGWWSNHVKGKERSAFWMWWWLAIRNPANNFSRYTDLCSCKINACSVEYYGDYESPDNKPFKPGSHFVIATNKTSGRKYYSYREVSELGSGTGWAINKSYGFKLKPSHGDVLQDPDDADKGFTWRPKPYRI